MRIYIQSQNKFLMLLSLNCSYSTLPQAEIHEKKLFLSKDLPFFFYYKMICFRFFFSD